MNRKDVSIGTGVLLALILSYFVGRKSVKPLVITKDKIVEKQVEKIKEVKVSVVNDQKQNTENRDINKNLRRKTVIIKKPDGTVITKHTVEDKSTDKTKTFNSDIHLSQDVVAKVVEKEIVKIEEHIKIIKNDTNWLFSVGAGYHVVGDEGSVNLLPVNNTVVTASAQKHIVGPVYAGVWATSTGVVGVVATASF